MSQLRDPAFDRIVALVLRTGAFACFIIMYFFFFPDAGRVLPPPNGVGLG